MSSKPRAPRTAFHLRWVQLLAGVLGMVAIANMQYGWTLFVEPIHKLHGWKTAEIQVAFTLFVLAETWLVPVEAYLVDRFGPRIVTIIGGLLVALAWLLNAGAESLTMLYVGAVVGGIGAGAVYGCAIGSALKWFPDRRGLAAGVTAAAFGAGSAVTVLPIANLIKHSGYQSAFIWFGLGQGAAVLVAASLMRAPKGDDVPAALQPKPNQSVHEYRPVEMLRAPIFYLMYAMMTMTTLGGIMAVAQLGPIAKDFKVADMPVHLAGITMAALPLALILERILNGFSRPFFGWVSDHFGRENTMAVAFTLEAAAILALMSLAHHHVAFVILSGLAFFAWGEIYSLFPALSCDLFGRKFAATNYGLLYTAKGTAALLIPLGSVLQAKTGSWMPIFALAITFDCAAALLALWVLKPMRAKWVARELPETAPA